MENGQTADKIIKIKAKDIKFNMLKSNLEI